MDVRSLHRQMASHDQWRSELRAQLVAFQDWFRNHRIRSREAEASLHSALALLTDNRFKLACVGEFSRGKTELINALLYGEYGQRLLPSKPGRTTMCPTEIYHEPDSERCCVRLLPIETRRGSASIESYRRIPEKWVSVYFDPHNPRQVNHAVSQIAATKAVSESEAHTLGFDGENLTRHPRHQDRVEIPAWRHSLINLDHPLLRQGLHIIDTPGLNALGNEPELTLNTLPRAQAIVFLLAADAGVSASDMAIWSDHIEALRDNDELSVLVLLNKIDALWNDLGSDEEISRSIREVRETTARLLKLPMEHVIPISAREGLMAKASQDRPRLLRSSLLKMEMLLAERIVDKQRELLEHPTIRDVRTMADKTYQLLEARIQSARRELSQLRGSGDVEARRETVEGLRQRIREAHRDYHRQTLSLRSSQHLLERQRESLVAPVEKSVLEKLIAESTAELEHSWTTVGLIRCMSAFFEALEHKLGQLDREAERANRLLASIYERPEYRGALPGGGKGQAFRTAPFHHRLRQLRAQADQFRLSLETLFASKSTVIRRFMQSLIREVRSLFAQMEGEAERWSREALGPLMHQKRYQKQLLEKHMMRLARFTNDDSAPDAQLHSLETSLQMQETALARLGEIRESLGRGQTRQTPPPGNVVDFATARREARAASG